MARLTEREIDYLTSEKRLGRLATVDPDGTPHVVPVGWTYRPEDGVIEVSGRDFAATHKFHNAVRHPRAALVVDDVLPPWRPRCVMVRGRVSIVDAGTDGHTESALRIFPDSVVSWGLDGLG